MAYPEHNRRSFFKYTSADTAIKVLESSSVLYSSPIRFNDPFDVQSGLHFDFDINSLPDRIIDSMEELVLHPDRPPVSEAGDFGRTIILMWEKKETHGFPKEEIRKLFREPLRTLQQRMIELQEVYQKMWWRDFMPRLRVFSVSEEKDNLLMWSHYAEYHTGVVFEFRVMPEQDNPLCVAKPIQYRKDPPTLLTWQEFFDNAIHDRSIDYTSLLHYAYLKSDIWTYEKEWRVYDLLSQPDQTLATLYPLKAGEIAAVYLGCKIDPAMKGRVIERMGAAYSDAEIYQAEKMTDAFRLKFTAISSRPAGVR